MRTVLRVVTAWLAIACVAAGCGGPVSVPGAVGVIPEIQTGRADAGETAISISTDDWTYGVPSDGVTWIDKDGSLHDTGRPDCLAPGVSRQIRFAAVQVTVQGSTWRPVIWVSCR
jgi:predicted small lipoprotein YifL